MMTCNGCHSSQEAGVSFQHVKGRQANAVAQLSPFLTGTTVNDIFTGVPRTFNELERRRVRLHDIVCSP